MLVSAVMEKTIAISAGSLHDTDHFLKAYALAKTIAETDGLDTRTQETLELAAVCTTSPARSAARSTATPSASIRSRKVRRSWMRFSQSCPPARRMRRASHGWSHTIIPTRMWTVSTIGFCLKRTFSSTRAKAGIRARQSRPPDSAFSAPPPGSACSTVCILGYKMRRQHLDTTRAAL